MATSQETGQGQIPPKEVAAAEARDRAKKIVEGKRLYPLLDACFENLLDPVKDSILRGGLDLPISKGSAAPTIFHLEDEYDHTTDGKKFVIEVKCEDDDYSGYNLTVTKGVEDESSIIIFPNSNLDPKKESEGKIIKEAPIDEDDRAILLLTEALKKAFVEEYARVKTEDIIQEKADEERAEERVKEMSAGLTRFFY